MEVDKTAGSWGDSWRRNGFSLLFSLFLGLAALSLFIDDPKKIGSLERDLTSTREREDREIAASNDDITALQGDLRGTQDALRRSLVALAESDSRSHSAGAPQQVFDDPKSFPRWLDAQEAPLSPGDLKKLQELQKSLRSIREATEANWKGYIAAAEELARIRFAIAGSVANSPSTPSAPWTSYIEPEAQKISEVLKKRAAQAPETPSDLDRAEFYIEIANDQLATAEQLLSNVQVELTAAEAKLSSVQKQN